MLIVLVIGFIAGLVIDNMFAPRVTIIDGKLTFEWKTKK